GPRDALAGRVSQAADPGGGRRPDTYWRDAPLTTGMDDEVDGRYRPARIRRKGTMTRINLGKRTLHLVVAALSIVLLLVGAAAYGFPGGKTAASDPHAGHAAAAAAA